MWLNLLVDIFKKVIIYFNVTHAWYFPLSLSLLSPTAPLSLLSYCHHAGPTYEKGYVAFFLLSYFTGQDGLQICWFSWNWCDISFLMADKTPLWIYTTFSLFLCWRVLRLAQTLGSCEYCCSTPGWISTGLVWNPVCTHPAILWLDHKLLWFFEEPLYWSL